jgi:hypothetical protein
MNTHKTEVIISYYPPSAYCYHVGRALARWRKAFPKYAMSHPFEANKKAQARWLEILAEEERKRHVGGQE